MFALSPWVRADFQGFQLGSSAGSPGSAAP
jgi:hypothetical protein